MAWDDPKTPYEELTYQIELKRDLRLYNGADASAWYALRAVVGLHKPSQEVGGICDENGEELWVCGICPDGDGLQNYPCPTIRAIEKELM